MPDVNDAAVQRRLTTILAADVVGYSRLMTRDEPGTLADFTRIKAEILHPTIDAHGGRVVNIVGDSVLVEFASVVDGVHCAMALQAALARFNEGRPEDTQMRLRIGLNIGDVIVQDDALFGNGVNVAARLEGLADPGGVCVSGSVRDEARGKVDFGFEDLGEHSVKNIPEPVRCYRVVDSAMAAAPSAENRGHRRNTRRLLLGGIAILLAVAGLALWQAADRPEYAPVPVGSMAFPLPDKPSLAVLPFRSGADDDGQSEFAEGISEDLITDLSKISGLFVIARNSSFTFRGQDAPIRAVAEQLGVRYVLVGSVRTAGGQLRLNAQLVDATTGGQVWADRFDGDMANIFDVQDRFVLRIVEALELQLSTAEAQQIARADTNDLRAKEAFQKGWALFSRFNAVDNARAIPHFERAVELDPNYGRAYGALALVYMRGSVFNWSAEIGESEANLYNEYVPRYLAKARENGSALAHVVEAMRQLFYRDRYIAGEIDRIGANSGTGNAIREAARAIALQPSDPEAHVMMAWAQIAAGNPREGLSFLNAAKRLNPRDRPAHYVFFEAAAHVGLGDTETAAEILADALRADPTAIALTPLAAAVNAQLANRDAAQAAITLWKPGLSGQGLQNAVRLYFFPIRWSGKQTWLNDALKDGLFLATLPADVTVETLREDLGASTGQDLVQAIRSLGWFGGRAEAAVPDLIALLGAQRRSLRREAAITLGKIGTAARGAVPKLEMLVDEPLVGYHAKTALDRINGR